MEEISHGKPNHSGQPPTEKTVESVLDKYAAQEIIFLGVVTIKLDDGITVVKRVVTLRTKGGEIISEDEGRDIETEEELDDAILHQADRIWLSPPW